jgi:hypothetical protein
VCDVAARSWSKELLHRLRERDGRESGNGGGGS